MLQEPGKTYLHRKRIAQEIIYSIFQPEEYEKYLY